MDDDQALPFRSDRNFALLTCQRRHSSSTFGIFYGENPLQHSFTLLLLELSFVVVTTRIVRFILKPLKQPRVISEIIGGIIIGPSVLGRNKKFAAEMFPETAQYVFRNIGVLGFMYFLFLIGVKMDFSQVKKAGKKHLYISIVGVVVPTAAVTVVAMILRNSMDKQLAKFSSIGAIASALGITSFPVLYPILKELNLLSSEIGRMAMSITVISDAIGVNCISIFEAIKQGEGDPMNALWYMISLVVLVTFMMTFFRRAMHWIIKKTPEGQPVDQGYVVAILLSVSVIGFLTDFLGIAIANGPLWLGLVIPDGPPLGATLVEKSETIVMEILMPFSFAFVGLYTDVFAMRDVGWLSLAPLFAMAMTGYLSKLASMLITSLFLEVPLKDAITLSLILSLRGQVDLLLFIHWMDKLIIMQPHYTLMVLLTIMVTGTASPCISILYDPTRPYMINKRRTIQHTASSKGLRVVLCIHDQESVSGFINLLDFSNPTANTPFSIFSLHLIELVGRASPMLIDHELHRVPSCYATQDQIIHSALENYQETRSEFLKLHAFTAVSPKRSMYQDICELALNNKATIIILPFHKEQLDHLGTTHLVRAGLRSVNFNVLDHSPCSVGILVDKSHLREYAAGQYSRRHSIAHHFVMLFLGGADAREALTFADRMVENQDVFLTVVRFLPYNGEQENHMEKKLDDGVVTWFWVKNERNTRVVYREVVVRNGFETVAAIRAMNNEIYELWITGRKQGINPVLIDGLSDWSENLELGIIGDYVASFDFGSTASALVVQQQIMRALHGTRRSRPCSPRRIFQPSTWYY